MSLKRIIRSSSASIAIVSMLQSSLAFAAVHEKVHAQPASSPEVARIASKPESETALTHDQKLALLKQKVKYVFVLFQENRSFDFHLGTFPGAEGIFKTTASETAGQTQSYVDTNGNVQKISQFLIPQTVVNSANATVALHPEDTDSVDHSHAGIDNGLDVDANGLAHNDRFALNEEGLTTNAQGTIVSKSTGLPPTKSPTEAQVQKAELVMSHIDCDTVPFLWQYADRFTLFDNFHQTVIGPSTPNALALFAGQSGTTQWALHPDEASSNTTNPDVQRSGGQPIVGDPGPFPGSNLDTSPVKPPYNPGDENPATPAYNQTYASLGLSFGGPNIKTYTAQDENPAADLLDVQDDISAIATQNPITVHWGWYQEGFDHEPTDGKGPTTYSNYIIHHEAPQYFGYIADNPYELTKLHGLGDFFGAIGAGHLPSDGGVYYVRGGYGNNDFLKPVDPNPAVQANFTGNDDHPGYSDAQISEALLADEIDAIAKSPYWSQSAIIITYDETDGLYDHTTPHIRSYDPEGNPLEGGPRIPTIVISPYGNTHTIDSAYAEHSSVIKFIDELFSLTPLGQLPDEVKAQKLGVSEFNQTQLVPHDADPSIDDLFGAFDNDRLTGSKAPVPAAYATIAKKDILSLPHYGGQGCKKLGITPTDYYTGTLIDPAPADFNPRPGSTPGIPTQAGWNG